jgi:hypothetical protein
MKKIIIVLVLLCIVGLIWGDKISKLERIETQTRIERLERTISSTRTDNPWEIWDDFFVGDNWDTTDVNYAPFNFYWQNSLSQSLYLASEINKFGTITAVEYIFDAVGDINEPKPIKIWIATTTKSSFDDDDDWIDYDQFTLVYDGLLDTAGNVFPILIPFDEPFEYTSGNLVIMTNRMWDTEYFSSNNRYQHCNTANIRTLAIQCDDDEIDPTDHSEFGSIGYLTMPNMFLWFAKPEHDLSIYDVYLLDGRFVEVNMPVEIHIGVTNVGLSTAPAYTVKLLLSTTAGDLEIGSLDRTNLESGEYDDGVIFFWEPTVTGKFYLFARVIYAADENSANNETYLCEVWVLPEFIESYIGGWDFDTTCSIPFNYYWSNSLNQTIYLSDEVDCFGEISAIRYEFFGEGDIHAGIPVKVWMATTTKTNFVDEDDWIPLEQFQLVYEGPLNVDKQGYQSIFILLDESFNYSSDNLVIMTNRTWTDDWFSSYNTWTITVTDGENRSIVANCDDETINPATWNVTPFIVQGFPDIGIYFFDRSLDDIDVPSPVSKNQLSQNYPNPFNPTTNIQFSVDKGQETNVTIEVFNIRGQKVKTLVNENFSSGEHSVVWNGDDENGRSVGSGIYFYRMQTENFTETKKMILMK